MNQRMKEWQTRTHTNKRNNETIQFNFWYIFPGCIILISHIFQQITTEHHHQTLHDFFRKCQSNFSNFTNTQQYSNLGSRNGILPDPTNLKITFFPKPGSNIAPTTKTTPTKKKNKQKYDVSIYLWWPWLYWWFCLTLRTFLCHQNVSWHKWNFCHMIYFSNGRTNAVCIWKCM